MWDVASFSSGLTSVRVATVTSAPSNGRKKLLLTRRRRVCIVLWRRIVWMGLSVLWAVMSPLLYSSHVILFLGSREQDSRRRRHNRAKFVLHSKCYGRFFIFRFCFTKLHLFFSIDLFKTHFSKAKLSNSLIKIIGILSKSKGFMSLELFKNVCKVATS